MTLYVGDVRDGLRQFAADGVRAQTCVTSPPFWGLRDYGTATWDGGDAACDHVKTTQHRDQPERPKGWDGAFRYTSQPLPVAYGNTCGKCGARRIDRQIGLEPTPAEYVATLVDVFRLVRDVLADDGTLWLNLGDSYNSSSQNNHGKGGEIEHRHLAPKEGWAGHRPLVPGLKVKDLVGIPWRVAFALQADGWYLRSDIIWHKPNPMPESVTDRPTKAHEYLFLLTKRASYYYDAAAIAEPGVGGRVRYGPNPKRPGVDGNGGNQANGTGNPEIADERNRRTVWTIATEPYADAHFATFPTALVEPCVLAGSRPGDVVLDPFMGSGTVAKVAQSLGRRWIGCELSSSYAEMIKSRSAQLGMAFA